MSINTMKWQMDRMTDLSEYIISMLDGVTECLYYWYLFPDKIKTDELLLMTEVFKALSNNAEVMKKHIQHWGKNLEDMKNEKNVETTEA